MPRSHRRYVQYGSRPLGASAFITEVKHQSACSNHTAAAVWVEGQQHEKAAPLDDAAETRQAEAEPEAEPRLDAMEGTVVDSIISS